MTTQPDRQDGDGLQDCQPCHGTGRYMGRFGHNDPDCPNCRGSGKVPHEPTEMEIMTAELERQLKTPTRDAAEGAVPERETWWLAERIGQNQYAAEYGELPSLTPDPWRAARFKTEKEAFDFILRLATLRDEMQQTEHIFINKPHREHRFSFPPRDAALVATPQPAPDAWGRKPVFTSAKNPCVSPQPAPPTMRERFQYDAKPAPDAMRESLIANLIGRLEKGPYPVRWKTASPLTEDDRQDIVTILSESAPVPSPDGAGGLYFEPSGDGMGACIHDANGAIICEAEYADFESDPSYPERVMKSLVQHFTGPLKDAPQVPQGAGIGANDLEHTPRSPSSPARRDREEIARAVIEVLDAALSDMQQSTDLGYKIADALPVQPGAGETRQGVCTACGGHGVVRVPVVGGPFTNIAERESHDNEGEE